MSNINEFLKETMMEFPFVDFVLLSFLVQIIYELSHVS